MIESRDYSKIAVDNSNLMMKLPNNYEQSLELFMKEKRITEEELAYASALSVRTISRRRVLGTRTNTKITTIIQIIIGLKLQPPFSEHLLRQAGYILNNTEEHEAYRYLLLYDYDKGIDHCNQVIKRFKRRR